MSADQPDSASRKEIHRETRDGVMIVTLNRPEKLNAFTGAMALEVRQAFEAADKDDAVRVVVVTGAGRAFCAGADMSSGAQAFSAEAGGGAQLLSGDHDRMIDAIFNCRKPSIAAINGPAFGVGVTMTLPMDVRLSSSEAKFGFVFTRLGLAPEAASAWFLPRIVGVDRALLWCLRGQTVSAQEALAAGLVTEVIAPEALQSAALLLADEIVRETSAVAVAVTRHMLWRLPDSPNPRSVLELDVKLSQELGTSNDAREATEAFVAKRRPNFQSKVSSDMPASFPW